MNLKFRNILISVGVVTLIGIATAGLIVSIQTHKDASKDEVDDSNYFSREDIGHVLEVANDLYDQIPKKETFLTNPRTLRVAIDSFEYRWDLLDEPEEKHFNEVDPSGDLKWMFGQLKASINLIRNPKME